MFIRVLSSKKKKRKKNRIDNRITHAHALKTAREVGRESTRGPDDSIVINNRGDGAHEKAGEKKEKTAKTHEQDAF